MKIAAGERKKINEIFKVLGLSDKEIIEHMDALGDRLLMDAVAQALVESEDVLGEEIKTKDDVAEFFLKNYSEEEIKNFTDLVFRDAVVEYFAKITKDAPEEKKDMIEEILNSIE
ncbi:MAG: hypothetical protein HGA61_01635 [Candidatus Moranbacteria bacterium]|nr:hypothetical protein [Candidatus Moranbacteria bacterium]